MLTPVGVLGGLRGVFFFNMGGAGFNGSRLHTLMTQQHDRVTGRSSATRRTSSAT